MDQELYDRWRQGRAPFSGRLLRDHPDHDLSVAELRQALATLWAALSERYPTLPHVHTLKDWHEHDGYISTSEVASWADITTVFASERALWAACAQDYGVYTAVYPDDGSFLLRWQIIDEDPGGAGVIGAFDLAAADAILTHVRDALLVASAPQLTEEAAQSFFDRRYRRSPVIAAALADDPLCSFFPRVMRHTDATGTWFGIHEVTFDSSWQPISWSPDCLSPKARSVDELRQILQQRMPSGNDQVALGDSQDLYGRSELAWWLEYIDREPIDYA